MRRVVAAAVDVAAPHGLLDQQSSLADPDAGQCALPPLVAGVPLGEGDLPRRPGWAARPRRAERRGRGERGGDDGGERDDQRGSASIHDKSHQSHPSHDRHGARFGARGGSAPRLHPVTFRLYDTATREVRDFVPLEAGRAGIYVCGLTVQAEPHVGHVRSAVNFDVLRRWLTRSGYDVTFIRNVTDIDDKILDQGRPSRAAPGSTSPTTCTARSGQALASINVLPPTYEPGATGHIPEMLELIGELIERRARLRRRGRLRATSTSTSARGRRTASSAGSASTRCRTPATPTPAASATRATSRSGRAGRRTPSRRRRPGRRRTGPAGRAGTSSARRWPASTSAPRSTSTAAASTCSSRTTRTSRRSRAPPVTRSRRTGCTTPGSPPSGEKMSKSLGNSLLVPAVLQRVRGIELRFYMVSAHYRSHVEFSFEALDEAAAGFRRIENFLERAGGTRARDRAARRRSSAAMDDDLGTPAAIAVVLRHRARGQQRARRRRGRRQCRRPRCARCSTCSACNPARPGLGRRRPRRRPAHRGRRRTGRRAARPARPGPCRQGLRRRRRDPRPDQGRRHRDRGHPDRPEMEPEPDAWQLAAQGLGAQDRARSRPPVPAVGYVAGSRARARRRRRRTGRTTRPTRTSSARRRRPRPGPARPRAPTPSGWPAATRSSSCCARASR